jgi:hypothetical protein
MYISNISAMAWNEKEDGLIMYGIRRKRETNVT